MIGPDRGSVEQAQRAEHQREDGEQREAAPRGRGPARDRRGGGMAAGRSG